MGPTEVEVAAVWREGTLVGTITRSRHGSLFEYDRAFYDANAGLPGGVAIHLPFSERKHETLGVNLHPYFAGLLPEGLRLRALVERVKTSEDDLLSLLVAAGADTIGDLAVVPAGAPPPGPIEPETWKPAEVRFSDLFEESLGRMGNPTAEPTIPGVQAKLSAATISFPIAPVGRASFILKLNPPKLPRLVENEHFFMAMAKACGLRTAPTRLVHDRDGAAGLLVQRFDREWSKETKSLRRIHQEDACQFLDRYPADKYRLSCREIAEGIRDSCAAPIPELARFVRLVAFSYLIANGDLHAKNVSILREAPGFVLSPAYDLLSTFPYGDRNMALKLDGRDANLRRSHFLTFSARLGLREQAVASILDELCDRAPKWIDRLDEIGLDVRKTRLLRDTMIRRREQLGTCTD